MCVIIGLYLKNKELQTLLGELFQPMMIEMSDRGSDSAGFALFHRPTPQGQIKFFLSGLHSIQVPLAGTGWIPGKNAIKK